MFTNPNDYSGSICGDNPSIEHHKKYDGSAISDDDCNRMDISNFHMDSRLLSRYNQLAVYKAFMDNFGESTMLHNLWIDHFKCGVWAIISDFYYTKNSSYS